MHCRHSRAGHGHRRRLQGQQLRDYFSSRSLTLSEIYAALAYYYDHQKEIDAACAEDEELGRPNANGAQANR